MILIKIFVIVLAATMTLAYKYFKQITYENVYSL